MGKETSDEDFNVYLIIDSVSNLIFDGENFVSSHFIKGEGMEKFGVWASSIYPGDFGSYFLEIIFKLEKSVMLLKGLNFQILEERSIGVFWGFLNSTNFVKDFFHFLKKIIKSDFIPSRGITLEEVDRTDEGVKWGKGGEKTFLKVGCPHHMGSILREVVSLWGPFLHIFTSIG